MGSLQTSLDIIFINVITICWGIWKESSCFLHDMDLLNDSAFFFLSVILTIPYHIICQFVLMVHLLNFNPSNELVEAPLPIVHIWSFYSYVFTQLFKRQSWIITSSDLVKNSQAKFATVSCHTEFWKYLTLQVIYKMWEV